MWTKSLCSFSERELVDQLKEEQTDNPIFLIGDVTYVDNFPKFDESNDDVLQTETKFAEQSVVGLWEED